MTFTVSITDTALRDLNAIHDYLLLAEGADRALSIIDQIDSLIDTLEHMPERGNIPKELSDLGLHKYRELHDKPYRIFYSIDNRAVTVLLITDGRRDMQTLLRHRMLND